jgi:uncharacterized protein YPO0396
VRDLEKEIDANETQIIRLKEEAERLLEAKNQFSSNSAKQMAKYSDLDREIVRLLENAKISDAVARDRDGNNKVKLDDLNAIRKE